MYLRGWRDLIGVNGKTDLSERSEKNFFKQSKRYKRHSFFDLWNFSACSADGPRNTLRRINHVHLFALTSKYCSHLISLSCHDYAGTAPISPLLVNWSTNYFVWSTGICTFCIFNLLHFHIILSSWLQAFCLLHLLHPISRLLLFVQWQPLRISRMPHLPRLFCRMALPSKVCHLVLKARASLVNVFSKLVCIHI